VRSTLRGALGSSVARAGAPSGASTALAAPTGCGRPSEGGPGADAPLVTPDPAPTLRGPGPEGPRSARSAASLDTLKKHPSKLAPYKGNFGAGRTASLPPRHEYAAAWRLKVADELRVEARAIPRGGSGKLGKTGRSLLRVAEAFAMCGSHVRVLRCAECDALQEGSGELVTPEGGFPCNARTCPSCAAWSARKLREELRSRVRMVDRQASPRPARFAWKSLTLTTVYRPGDPAEVTREALRARALGVVAAFGLAWREGLGQKGAGAFWRVELGETGAVHMHVLYFGPFIKKSWLESKLRSAYDRCGFVYIREECDPVRAAGELAKYVTKTASPRCESWVTQGRVVMHPTLVARWEAATMSLRLHGYRGVLRHAVGAEVDGAVDGDAEWVTPEVALAGTCEVCGSDRLEPVTLTLAAYVRHQHDRGKRALRGSRAPPPAPRAPAPTPQFPRVVLPPVEEWSVLDDAPEAEPLVLASLPTSDASGVEEPKPTGKARPRRSKRAAASQLELSAQQSAPVVRRQWKACDVMPEGVTEQWL